MKKAIYLLAATALMASCNQEVLVDTPDPQPEAPRRIGFETFVNKATRANSTALNDFYPTFNVYGWKTVGSDVTCVFEDIPVEYFTADAAGDVVYATGKPSDEWPVADPFAPGWFYENIRYWDKMASQYQFSAYVPAAASGVVACTKDGVIKIGTAEEPITVEGKNLMATPATALAFTGYEYDYMTAQSTTATSPVALTFKHLQAKFNVRIKLAESVTTAQDVSVQKIEIHNLGDVAYYASNATAASAVDGWTLGTPTATYVPKVETAYTLNAATNYHNHYVMEQLIIPQTIKKSTAGFPSLTEYAEACIYVEYTIGTEVFKSFTPLANLFINSTDDTYTFKAGNQYTLNINIGPEPIEFTAEVATWADEIHGNHNIN